MAHEQKIEFRVKKVTLMRKQCTICGGTGKREQRINGLFKQVPCCHCINGISKIEHMTDVSLIEALTELGIRFVLPASMKPKELTTENTDKA